mmetsp:Transcript_48121/g.71725  ORF Transcript_48121/g.71725 Transcript_48121/m.71725 type:complete len:480 (-) Transcript_48121:226-1665(-)|eukprot:CAMPEP_0194046006 /NCGR_PEP_ID=MMETSP0009_2-20130614/19117_1 /TAXON_ID=210454 /ORGANISM="Grammatophora oceanica, Strain CCMP 410" /LENGTH=479 /DNA_ID=CAMNT_0038691107 /DNA_START=74 /DNA_END=1513 /DNA_ORIENTATION=+
MPSAKRFVLKDSPADVLDAADEEPKGRNYDASYAEQPGGVKVEDLVMGMKYAALAITDDNEDSLKKVSKTMPWHMKTLEMITGSEEEAVKPLTEILKTHFNLETDCLIDESRLSKAGHFLDTQGYIAHNDDTIVLAYRCTTSGYDWLTNLSTTSSAWEPDVDVEQGHSGYISCVSGFCCTQEVKPRVHTGFYNNFLVTAPMIEKHILPLLAEDQPPRKLYVVGHSLGAGIANMAACYFLTEMDWKTLPHKLLVITAGSPHSCKDSMVKTIDGILEELRPLDKAVVCRLVRDKDVVPTVPPAVFGFRHLEKLVYITKDEQVLIGPRLKNVVNTSTMKEIMAHNPDIVAEEAEKAEAEAAEEDKKTTYDKRMKLIPRPLRDHCPDFYLKPLQDLLYKEHPELAPPEPEVPEQAPERIVESTPCIPSKSNKVDDASMVPVIDSSEDLGASSSSSPTKSTTKRKKKNFFRRFRKKSPDSVTAN